MAVQILSDLHLEAPPAYDIFKITPKAPYLALLGDIGNAVAHKSGFMGFLSRQLKQFRAVLFVLGNHEAYHSRLRIRGGIILPRPRGMTKRRLLICSDFGGH
jgi:hypothetical protein